MSDYMAYTQWQQREERMPRELELQRTIQERLAEQAGEGGTPAARHSAPGIRAHGAVTPGAISRFMHAWAAAMRGLLHARHSAASIDQVASVDGALEQQPAHP